MSDVADLFAPPSPRLYERLRAADPEAITIYVAGEPQGKGRARSRIVQARGRQFVSTYTPAKTRNYETTLLLAAQDVMAGRDPLDGPLQVELTAVFAVPSSWSGKKQRLALAGVVRPCVAPDWDNIGKCCDGLNGVVFRDDKQIVDGWVAKLYGTQPGITIVVRPL